MKSEKRNISTETLYNYIDYCKTACLLHIYGNNLRDINQTLENIIYVELLRRGYEVRIGKAGDLEVDFVARKGGERIYVQVSYLLAGEETVEREFGVLERMKNTIKGISELETGYIG